MIECCLLATQENLAFQANHSSQEILMFHARSLEGFHIPTFYIRSSQSPLILRYAPLDHNDHRFGKLNIDAKNTRNTHQFNRAGKPNQTYPLAFSNP